MCTYVGVRVCKCVCVCVCVCVLQTHSQHSECVRVGACVCTFIKDFVFGLCVHRFQLLLLNRHTLTSMHTHTHTYTRTLLAYMTDLASI